ncbi:aldehyde dehydrogenase [Aureispira anguillae]|uniref:Aldehyde dehydrogenase n=1 Tax=Aureispira anguillae TaxID=2864201 RepID=A0A916DTE2_9BACT|nr:aldehyde dehydrogenase [Aureispira anguillae]BDS11712.1 aldehyde dehydrogenase [Aureispira anguillae]
MSTITDTNSNLTANQVQTILQAQRDYFASNATKDLNFRKQQLQKLKQMILDNESALLDALHKDLHKHEFEAYATEIGFVLVDIDKSIAKLKTWARPKKVKTPPFHYVASSYIKPDPYGNILIIAPWNYPVQLLLAPLVGAIAAGNTAILKPSEYAVHTSTLLTRLINATFDAQYITMIEGAVPETQLLLNEKFDFIFFTGSTKVGNIVYQAAAKHLTPVALELGGKSPCIVDTDIQLDYTAKRIIWGKFINSGQSCIAPDYLLVDRKIKDALVAKLKFYIHQFFGENPQESEHLGRIINEIHFDRLAAYLKDGDITEGGQMDRANKYIAPTILENVGLESAAMQEEIFGPILPIVTYGNLKEAIDLIKSKPKPLALYIFSKNNKKIDRILSETSAGGVTINDTLMHMANGHLPFGGVGDSGIGAYHGPHSFDLFSHKKAVLHRSFLVEEPIRYAPYKLGLKWIKKIMDWSL